MWSALRREEQDDRHPRGWKVDPAPNGRGTPPPRSGGRFRWVGFVAFLLALLAINSWLVSQVQGPEPRIRVPYSPAFLDQVHADNVESVSSRASTLQGEFRRAVRYPPGDKHARPAIAS
jgi:cell division protease FtsH